MEWVKDKYYVLSGGLKMEQNEKDNYTKLLDIDAIWLLDYLAEMIAENDDAFEYAIKTKDLDYVKNIIEKHIY